MTLIVEKRLYSIPAQKGVLHTPTGQRFRQLQSIPVEQNEKLFPPHSYYYARFRSSVVNINAGSENSLKKARRRVRWQMVYALQNTSRTLKDPTSSENAKQHASETSQIIEEFIRLI